MIDAWPLADPGRAEPPGASGLGDAPGCLRVRWIDGSGGLGAVLLG